MFDLINFLYFFTNYPHSYEHFQAKENNGYRNIYNKLTEISLNISGPN